MGNRNNIVRTAEKMPEENYGMRPGAQTEVRTFGQQVAHVAFYNFLWCSQAKGEKNPNPGNLDKLTSKAEIMKVLNDAFHLLRRRLQCANRRLGQGDDRYHPGKRPPDPQSANGIVDPELRPQQ